MNTPQSPYHILITGQGGQGTTFLAQLLGEAAHKEKKKALFLPHYGTGILGGRIYIHLSIAEQKHQLTPYPQAFNIIIDLHYQPLDLDVHLKQPYLVLQARTLQGHHLAQQIGYPQGLNTLMIGFLLKQIPLCSPQTIAWLLKQKLNHHPKLILTKNLELLKLGIS